MVKIEVRLSDFNADYCYEYHSNYSILNVVKLCIGARKSETQAKLLFEFDTFSIKSKMQITKTMNKNKK